MSEISTSKTYYYARVSSKDQNLDRQIDAFKALGADDRSIFYDKASGKSLNRENYMALRDVILRPGDTLVIKSIDRLSRTKADISNELRYYSEKGIRVKILDLPTTLVEVDENQSWVIELVNNILIEVLSSMAQQERENIRRRQAEGIATAKKAGKYLGRPKIKRPANWNEVYAKWKAGEITAVEAMKLTSLNRGTFYRFAKRV